MSTGYSGNYGYPMPTNWSFDQFDEYDFSGGFGLDKDAFSGRDTGFAYTNSGKYNRDKVKEYAKEWAVPNTDIHNNKYFYFDKDCANFVSQCLYEAGFGMSTSWYSAFNPLKGETMTVEEDPEQINNPLWSNTWSVALEQYQYFSEQSHGYILSNVININNDGDEGTRQNIKQEIQNAKNQGLPIKVGDLMYFQGDVEEDGKIVNRVHHATIITKIDDNMIYYSGHSISRNNAPLINGFIENNDTNVKIVRVNDICFID